MLKRIPNTPLHTDIELRAMIMLRWRNAGLEAREVRCADRSR
jgi:hypothetical protein